MRLLIAFLPTIAVLLATPFIPNTAPALAAYLLAAGVTAPLSVLLADRLYR